MLVTLTVGPSSMTDGSMSRRRAERAKAERVQYVPRWKFRMLKCKSGAEQVNIGEFAMPMWGYVESVGG